MSKQRKDQERRRRLEIERITRLNNIANRCFSKYLFRNYFLRPLTILVRKTKEKEELARCHYELTLLRKVTREWIILWREQRNYKMQVAMRFHRQSLLWEAFDEWKKMFIEQKQAYQRAIDFYDEKILTRYWKNWYGKYVKHRNAMLKKDHLAMRHYDMRLKLTCFFTWKKFILFSDEIKEKDRRREAWRALIKKYVPPGDSRKPVYSKA